MLTKYLLPALGAGALMITLAACNPSTPTPDTGEAPMTEAPMPVDGGVADGVGDRTDYEAVPIPAGATGADPSEIAREVFGSPETGEGNFAEQVEVVEETDNGALVVLTQTGLADDSVNGMRYRLEFVPEGDQWQLDWAGRQVRCQAGRGSEDWTMDLCN
jgi:hypothetical protein